VPARRRSFPPLALRNLEERARNQEAQKGCVAARLVRHVYRVGSIGEVGVVEGGGVEGEGLEGLREVE